MSTQSLHAIESLIQVYSDSSDESINQSTNKKNGHQKRIFLWSTRRVLSMAFHRAIYQLDGIKHFCEPFALPFYFGDQHKSIQFQHRQELMKTFDPCPTFAQSLRNITKQYSAEYHTVFIKEHALYAWPDVIPTEILSSSINTFIIRHPAKAIRSLYRQTLAKFDESLWDHVVTEEIGFKELQLMYDFVVHKLNQETIIIDADDLLSDPKSVLMKYCDVVGLEYNDCMLDWTNDYNKKEDAPWDFVPPSWITDVKQTKGFRKKDRKHNPNIEYPKYIDDAIQENMKYYEKLYAQRLKV